MFLRVVERRPDGIAVRGAKAHQTGASNSHEILVMPTQAMKPEDADYAVAFSVPIDAEGIFMIVGWQSCDTRKTEPSTMDNPCFGGMEALVIFNDVFVPNDRVFLNGETEFATVSSAGVYFRLLITIPPIVVIILQQRIFAYYHSLSTCKFEPLGHFRDLNH